MADAKWISGLHANMPVSAAARHVLAVRLGHVLERLPPAVEHADDDVENVHQLRVGTRRAAAAVRIFADCLAPKLHRRMRRVLKVIRRAAGDARDWDVFLETINARRGRRDAKHQAGVDFLLGFVHGQRDCAQHHLRDSTDGMCEKLKSVNDEIDASLSGAVRPGTLRDLAIPMLMLLLHEFEQAARGDLYAYEALHQVRIKGKQLRYAMELFESCFDLAFRERVYPSVADMQEILGRANDSHVADIMLAELQTRMQHIQPVRWRRYQPAVEELQLYHRRRLPKQRQLFVKWWAKWQSSGLSAALMRWLKA
jgi:CHAD domain-containing protein